MVELIRQLSDLRLIRRCSFELVENSIAVVLQLCDRILCLEAKVESQFGWDPRGIVVAWHAARSPCTTTYVWVRLADLFPPY